MRRPKQNSTTAPTTRGEDFARWSSWRTAGGDHRRPYSSTRPAGDRGLLGQLDRLAGPPSGCRLSEVGHRVGIRQYVERVFECLEVLDREHDHARAPVLGDHHPTVLGLDPFDDLGQTCLGIGQGDLFGSRGDHK